MAFSKRLEIDTIKKLLMIYCKDKHERDQDELCPECVKLQNYAEQRIEKCIYGDRKPVCSKCLVHCYTPEMREAVIRVMRYSGPKMLLRSPLLSARYFYRKSFKSTID